MSAVCVLTPIVISSWPTISAAVFGAAASLGFVVKPEQIQADAPRKRSVETEVPNSEVVGEAMGPSQKIVIQRDDITIEFGQNDRGACTVCVTAEGRDERELRKIGEEVAGRVVQQFAYHKLMSELKARKFTIVGEQMLTDDSVHVRIRL